MNHRRVGLVVSVVAIVATAWPVLRDPGKGDDFPLSTYPMFTTKDRGREQTFEYAVGWTAAGERRTIRPEHVAHGEVMQARMAFDIARRKRTRRELCARIAGRVARDGDLRDVVRIEIVSGRHHPLDFLVRGVRGPERALHRCDVPREGAP